MLLTRENTVHMFNFDSNTTVPLQYVALVSWKAWLTVPWDPIKKSRRLLKYISSDARFNFYEDEFVVLKCN